MRVLDCESESSCSTSLARLLDIERSRLERAVSLFDLDAHYKNNPQTAEAPEDALLRHVLGGGATPPPPESVCWFHATRVLPHTSFAEGIQPLNTRLESLWRQLEQLAGQWTNAAEWLEFRWGIGTSGGPGDYQYSLKARNAIHWGPYAFLVRDAVFCPRVIGNHDYLAVPEIVEDISSAYGARFGQDLLAAYRAATHPCVVKFVSPRPRPDVIAVALYYLHRRLRGEDLSLHTNTCFDGEGATIPAEAILRVDFVDY